jgi:polyisoprenoid-binding protein YceI
VGKCAATLVRLSALTAGPLWLAPLPALAARQAAAVSTPAATPVWSVDRAASRLSFRAALAGQPVDGVFKSWDAEIAFDPQNLRASHAVISVNTASAVTGQPSRDQLLPTGGWLWTRRFPKAQLITRAIVQTGPNRYLAQADLTIRGVGRRVSVPFTAIIGRGDTGRMQATLTIDRNLFGVGQNGGQPLTSPAPNVVLMMHLTAKKSR